MSRKQKAALIRWFRGQAGLRGRLAGYFTTTSHAAAYHRGARDAYQKAAEAVRDADPKKRHESPL